MKILAFFSKESTPRTYDLGVHETANNTVGKMLSDLKNSDSRYFHMNFRNLTTAVRVIKNLKNAAADYERDVEISMTISNVNERIIVYVDMAKVDR